jgi:hypothetical protein
MSDETTKTEQPEPMPAETTQTQAPSPAAQGVAAAMSSSKAKDPYPTDIPGAVMKDKDGNELFVTAGALHHEPDKGPPMDAVDHRLSEGWTLVQDRRPTPKPSR